VLLGLQIEEGAMVKEHGYFLKPRVHHYNYREMKKEVPIA
jgi:hypothetical protein